MKKILDNKHILLVVAFSFISAICLFMKSDDYIWYYVMEESKLEMYRVPNGRYFSNLLTYIMLRNPWLKRLFYTVILSLMVTITGKLADFGNKKAKTGIILSFFMLLLLPVDTFSETVNWFSGFTNYIFPFLLTASYIFFCFKTAFSNFEPKKWLAPVMLVFAFLSGLCMEYISIYNILFSVFAIALIKYKKKKIYPANIFYTIGAVGGIIVMLTNNTYSGIAENGDSIGLRKFEFSFSDMYMTLFKLIIPHYSSAFWIANIIITVCLFVMYLKNGKKYKYGTVCIVV